MAFVGAATVNDAEQQQVATATSSVTTNREDSAADGRLRLVGLA